MQSNILKQVIFKGMPCMVAALMALMPAAQARVIDNFNDNTKTGWTDFTFTPGFGLPVESGGKFTFEQPAAGQAIFSASRKTSELLELKEGRTLELRIDLLQGGAKDSFAILAFIPEGSNPASLGGYGVAKSTTDFLLSKSIGKYFYNEDPAVPVKQDNITLVLNLSVKNGSVHIRGQVLDRDAGDAVIFEQTAIDTPLADVMADGSDNPAAPFITKGFFSLYLYQDFNAASPEDPYRAVFDNAEVFEMDTAVLDDFNDNTKTDWTDFTFIPGFGLPAETGGQFAFTQPAAGQAIFSASQKTSKLYELKEGERLQMQVDVIQGGGKDSFAILSFTPQGVSPGTLAGYGLAKSVTDFLLVKGIGKYFYNENPVIPVKQDNITLVLTLTVRGGKVYFNAKVLDRDAGNAVIFEQSAVDTPAADVMANGSDDPAAPYITKGYFTLFLYQDFAASAPEDPYRAIFDNAIVSSAPVLVNAGPIINEILPSSFSSFLPATTALSFKVADDKPVVDANVSISLNGTAYTTTNGLTLTGSGNTKTASLAGKLIANTNYVAVLSARDAEGEVSNHKIYFDTFAASSLMLEVEDYNFDGGSYLPASVLIPEGSGPQADSYANQMGILDIDYSETRASANGRDTLYRSSDPIRMAHSFDSVRAKYAAAGGSVAMVFDYDVGDIVAGEWTNYTRNFATGSYEVYLRQGLVNLQTTETVLEEVTSNRTQPNQTTRPLGSFLGLPTGYQPRNFALTDGTGLNKIVLKLSGVTTLRLKHNTTVPGDSAHLLNYMLFLKVSDAGPQQPTVANLSPAPDSTTSTLSPAIRVEILNRDTSINTTTVTLTVNGGAVAPVVTPNAGGATVTHNLATLPASGALNTARIAFRDNLGAEVVASWSFTITYQTLLAANRKQGPGQKPGFKIRVVQAPGGSSLDNSLGRAEDQLRANSPIPIAVDVTGESLVINFAKTEGQNERNFPGDVLVPGIGLEEVGRDDFTMEARAYLELKKGIYRFGAITDDGYKFSAGATTAEQAPAIAFHNGGPANETVEFVVPEDGLYPVRFIWYERGGDGYAEWFSEDRSTGERLLIGDSSNAAAIKAWQETATALSAEESPDLRTWTNSTAAVIDSINKRVLFPIAGQTRYYRLRSNVPGSAAPAVTSVFIEAGKLVVTYLP